MTSLFELTKSQMTVYLLTAIEQPNIDKLYKIATCYKQTFKHIIIDKSKLWFLSTINIQENCHKGLGKLLPDAAYYRWLIPEYIDCYKCLYLDTDVIANKDITSFYNMNIDKFSIVGSSAKRYSHEIISGIMLMNLAYFRMYKIYDKLCNRTIEEFQNKSMIND